MQKWRGSLRFLLSDAAAGLSGGHHKPLKH